MNKIKQISLALLLGMSVVGCEDSLFENVNPDKAHENSAELGLPVLVFYAQQTVYDHSEYNVFLSQCLTTTGKSSTGSYPYKQGWEFLNINRHPQWRRHFYDIGVNASDVITNSRKFNSPNYEIIARTIYLMSTQLCTDAFGEMPMPGESWVIPGVAGGNAYDSQTPTYMPQETIYAWMLTEADRIIELYNANKNTPIDGFPLRITVDQDRVYAGDIHKWVGLVYAVKARLLLRNIPNITVSGTVCQQIIDAADAAINLWKDQLYEDVWFGSEPRYKFDGGTGEQNCPWGIANPKINSWESRDNRLNADAVPSKFFIEDCLGVINPGVAATKKNDANGAGVFQNYNGYGNDPRLALLLVPNEGPISASDPTTEEGHLAIRYLENNIGTSSKIKIQHYPNLYAGAYAKNDGYNCIFTMEELYFIKAEALYWQSEANKSQSLRLAQEATKYNIQRHLARFLADNQNCYPGKGNKPSITNGVVNEKAAANDKLVFDRITEAFLYNTGDNLWDGSGSKPARGQMYPVTKIGNKKWFFDPAEFSLEELMIQKYIAMYMQPEQWTDMRRYHYSNNRNGYNEIGNKTEIIYPKLRRPYNLYAPYWIDGVADPENTWIQRLNYDPQTEDIYNKDEVVRLGAYKDHKWLQKKMIWAKAYEEQASLTAQ